MVGLKRCGGNVMVNFLKKINILKRIHFIEQNIKVSEKLNDRKILAYLLYTTLIAKHVSITNIISN